jgi:proteasome accessory factor B
MADRMERLTNLLALLLETPRPLSLVEIAGELHGMYPEALPARRGAFERDKAALREIGVPIESEIVPGGEYAGQSRYWIDRGRYELTDLDLDRDEMRALQVAVAATRSGAGSESAQVALWKLGGVAAGDVAPVLATMPSLPALAPLRDAVARRAVVHFRYRDVDREVEPYGLLLRDGFWYLVGFDRVRADRRTYRVDRIDGGIEVGGAGAFARPHIDLREAVPTDPKLIGVSGESTDDAIVRVSPVRAGAVVREVGDERVVRRADDGSVEVAVPCANLDAFRSWVLGMMEHAEVLSPDHVRTHVVEWLERMMVER